MVVDEDIYLEHFGVKGMKWGIRRTSRLQRDIDVMKKVADGTASNKEARRVGLGNSSRAKKSAANSIRRGASLQEKINKGERGVTNALLKASGIRMQDLDYSTKKTKFGDSDKYSAQKSLGMKTIPDPTGSYEKAYKQMKREVSAHEKAMGKDKQVFEPGRVSPNIKSNKEPGKQVNVGMVVAGAALASFGALQLARTAGRIRTGY